MPGRRFPFPEVALRGRGRAPVLRRGQAGRGRRRLLLRLGNDRPRRDAAEQAGRWPSAVDLGDEQRGGRGRAEGAARARASPGRPRVGAVGHLRVHHQAAHRGRDHRQDAGRRADQGRLQVHRRVPDGRRLRGERRVLHAHLRGAAARRVATASSPRSRRCSGCGPGRAAAGSTTSRRAGTSPTPTACSRTSTRPRSSSRRSRRTTTLRSRSSSPTRTGCSSRSSQELPDHVEPVRLYEAYLRNFEIEAGRGAL